MLSATIRDRPWQAREQKIWLVRAHGWLHVRQDGRGTVRHSRQVRSLAGSEVVPLQSSLPQRLQGVSGLRGTGRLPCKVT